MEFFRKAKSVRFRSHHNKYLLADNDEESIWQDPEGTVKNAKWMVEINESGTAIRLKSCYGKYLTASNLQGRLGMKSKKVVQTLPKTLDTTVEWEPIREGFKVKLKMAGHDQFLRANGGVPPWFNSITHDTAHRKMAKEWALWNVDVVEIASPKKSTSDGGETKDGDSEQLDTCPSESDMTSSPTNQNSKSVKSEGSGDSQPPDTCMLEIDMTPSPAKKKSDRKQRKIRRGVVRTNPLSMFTMCTCSPPVDYQRGSIIKSKNDKKGSKPS
ncbi:uncharacterized protein LOC126797415 [Argentina anserina]|uniref:uncharacterized protein LOC126797415 n=1 Tax=Argentina anserina TaxID=57926 RepID=UPI0021765417|nr:uncharacterized protein LOC126797415 [Potentilla anserina]